MVLFYWCPIMKNNVVVLIAGLFLSLSVFADSVEERIKPVGSLILKADTAKPVKVVKDSAAVKPVEVVAEKKEETVAPTVAVASADTAPATPNKTGKQIHDTICFVCHVLTAEAIKAPKTHSNEWDKRMAAGIDALVQSSIKGKGAMPPNAGNPDLSPADLKAAIEFMVSKQ